MNKKLYNIKFADADHNIREREVTGYPVGKFLFIHKELFEGDFWCISHKQTGMALRKRLLRRMNALELAKKVKDMIDWDFTDPGEVIVRDNELKVRKVLYPDNYIVKETIKQEVKSIIVGDPPDKLVQLADNEGYRNPDEMIYDVGHDNVVPGICMKPHCDYSTGVEPDQTVGWCEICNAGTVQSAMILAGLM